MPAVFDWGSSRLPAESYVALLAPVTAVAAAQRRHGQGVGVCGRFLQGKPCQQTPCQWRCAPEPEHTRRSALP